MEDNFNQDRLEEFFRKSLEHFEENPAPDSWEKIRRAIPEKDNKRNKGAWLWLSLLLLLLVVAGSHFFLSEKFDQLEERVENLETGNNENIQNSSTLSSTKENEIKENKSTIEQEQTSISQTIIKGTEKSETPTNTRTSNNKKNPITTNNKKQKTSFNTIPPPPVTQEEAIPNTSNNSNSVAPIAKNKKANPSRFEGMVMEDLPPVATEEEDEKSKNPLAENIKDASKEKKDDDQTSKFFTPEKDPGIIFPFELAYGIKEIAPDFFVDGASTSQSAWDIQLLGDIPINHKWTFQMGVGYRVMSFSGTQGVSGRYSEEGAVGNTDIGISKDYRFDVINSFTQISLLGKITQTFDDRSEDPFLENEDPIRFSTSVNHQTQHLIFPFLISRHGNGERWNWRVKTGLIGTVRIKNEIDATVFGIENENIQFDHQQTLSTYLYDGPKIEWALSAGLEYRAFGDYWLFAEPAMNLSIIGSYTGEKPFLYGGQMGIIWRPPLKEKKK